MRTPQAVIAALTSATVVVSCGSGPREDEGVADTLTVVADSSTEPGWTRIVPAFVALEGHQDITVATTFGASPDLVGDVVDGEPGDLVNLDALPDMSRLVRATKVSERWNSDATRGIPFTSVVTFVVRDANPLKIADWDDLVKPGVEVVMDDPGTCAQASPNLLAAYAVGSGGGRNPQAGIDFVEALVAAHVATKPDAACNAGELFAQGAGDVLIIGESRALELQRQSSGVALVNPPQTLEIAYPAAVVSGSTQGRSATALRNFLFTMAGQTVWAEAGFRPVDPGVAAGFAGVFPVPDTLWTVDDLGGWDEVTSLLDADDGVLTTIYRDGF